MSDDVDFAALEEYLYAGCIEAIARYRDAADPDDPAAFFAIDASPFYGKFHPSFDTASSARAGAEAAAARVAADRAWTRDPDPELWKSAHEYARQPSLRFYHDELGDWSHHMIHQLAWDVAAFTDSPRYDELDAGAGPDGWLEGNCRGVLTRVCDRLVDGGGFGELAIARPFGVGYGYASEPLVVCRIIY